MTNSDILKIEQGENINPTLDTLNKIAKALGVGLDELTGYQLRGKM
ncbi:helix-turn-helix transcriptional regulator [Patescibacteria group bacterium]|nr:helix-turn-helix transcriptional regulator [Patescibacteria group bacterium]MBU2219615.1 helix-turn-helix transcriptional regulator [Patescibacteria group bacterium]MBU2265350.1 helix-turn-helix transcriptional regulator [Patescibacteria group bacterium]